MSHGVIPSFGMTTASRTGLHSTPSSVTSCALGRKGNAVKAPKPTLSRRHLPRRLRRLVGTWKVEGTFVGGPEIMPERGTVTFRWLVKDALVVMHSRMKVAPETTAAIGADDTFNAFTML